MQKIAVLGCGWLGIPLAQMCLSRDYDLVGSTTTATKTVLLAQLGITPFLITVSEQGIAGDIDAFLENTTVLVIDIPPKLRGENRENFVQKIKNLVPEIQKSKVPKVLFVSSTSVFADNNQVVDQDEVPNPDAEAGKQLWETEKILQQNTNFQTTIVRFGGLVGPDRHPAKMLAGKTNVSNPTAPINLIHQHDCVSIILQIIETNSWGMVFNAVAPHHPSREQYYIAKTKTLGLLAPTFDYSAPSVGKTVLSDKLQTDLKYKFLVVGNL